MTKKKQTFAFGIYSLKVLKYINNIVSTHVQISQLLDLEPVYMEVG